MATEPSGRAMAVEAEAEAGPERRGPPGGLTFSYLGWSLLEDRASAGGSNFSYLGCSGDLLLEKISPCRVMLGNDCNFCIFSWTLESLFLSVLTVFSIPPIPFLETLCIFRYISFSADRTNFQLSDVFQLSLILSSFGGKLFDVFHDCSLAKRV